MALSEPDYDVNVDEVIEGSPDAMLGIAVTGEVRWLNPTAEGLFGGIAGRRLPELGWSAEEAKVWEAALSLVSSDGEEQRLRARPAAGGGRRQFDWILSPVRGDLLVVGRDVTELIAGAAGPIEVDSAMMQTQKLESLGVLAGGIAHDFNNLLMGVLGHADLALRGLPRGVPAREQLNKIVTIARRSSELCQQLLTYSDQGSLAVEPIDLRALVEEMTYLLRVSIFKSTTLEFDFADDLCAIEGDSSQLRQVVLNLILNASDAMGDQGGVIRLSLHNTDIEGQPLVDRWTGARLEIDRAVSLTVADSGEGIDDETLAKIFDPFFSTKTKGRGLGLAAVVGIVRSHSGAITVESKPGRGASFTVSFPAVDRGAPEPSDGPSSDPPWRGEGTIMVVDDEPNARRIAQLFLEEVGFDVILAENGPEALELFGERGQEVTAVVLDLTMPKMSGEETFRRLRQLREDLPVILSSGYPEQDVTRRFEGQPWAGFIQKPYRFAALVQKLREIL